MAEPSVPVTTSPVPLCAIGASDGGVQALRDFFSRIPPNLGLAYVAIIHVPVEPRSRLGGLLASCTAMPVHHVDDSLTVQPDRIYVIAPDRELVISGNRIATRPFSAESRGGAPIDSFFRSIANARGDGLAVVLTGAESQGATGLRDIKKAGGVVLVQDPSEAEYPRMPRSALASGAADFVGPVARLVDRIIQVTHSKRAANDLLPRTPDEDLQHIVHILRARTGHDFSSYKHATVLRRITRRMQVTHRDSLRDYADYLSTNPEEARELFGDLLISVTTFFRDPAAYEALAEQAIRPIFDGADADRGIRAWVAGCASGEEAYSMAILMLEEAERRRMTLPIQIFATDLDEGALATARDGRYPNSIQEDVSKDRLHRFFVREGSHFRIKTDVRDMVLFATHSVLKDPPFIHLDLISCRNLLIYLERNLQRQVCSLFHYGLKPHGFLFLGSAETAEAKPDAFLTINREARLYRARPQVSLSLPMVDGAPTGSQRTEAAVSRPHKEDRDYRLGAAHTAALESSAPPSILVDSEHRILHLSATAGRYLMPGAGPFTADLGVLVRAELRVDLRSALRRAFEVASPSLTLPVPVAFDDHHRRVMLHVMPVPANDDTSQNQALVCFLDGGVVGTPSGAADSGGGADEVHRLREELHAAEQRLRTARQEHENAIQDLRVANEELQSINEEYRSTAEELETSKEELQSMNEELQTLNAELKSKLECVSMAHSDLQNLVTSTDIGTLFLDPDLHIRMFTPRIATLFNVTAADIGRSISDFTHRLTYEHLREDAQRVLRDLAPLEHVVGTHDARWLMMRLRPYRTIDDRIDGVVLTFVDITEQREAVARMQESEERFRALVSATSDVIYRMNADWSKILMMHCRGFLAGTDTASPDWASTYLLPEDRVAVWDRIRQAITTKMPFELKHRIRTADGGIAWTLSRAVPLLDDDGTIREWFGAASNITEAHQNEERLRETRDLLSLATEASRLGWVTWDVRSGAAHWDARGRTILGLPEGAAGADWLDVVHPEDRPTVETVIAACIKDGRPFDMEYRVTHPDGSLRHIHGTGVFECSADGVWLRGTGLVRDITDLRNWEESQRLLVGELNHRVKNMLTVVQSIARQTRRFSPSSDAFVDAFEKRLQALSAAHALLTRSNWTGTALRSLIEDVTGSFHSDGALPITSKGPPIILSPNATISVSMALHELATNALKYGALSVPTGTVALSWVIDSRDDGSRLLFRWTEHGGPPVQTPTREGFGTRMLKMGIAHELDGSVTLDYQPTGLECTMDLPMNGTIRHGR